ncbi:zeta toxin family protein [Fusobacterium simiae]|uniref:zeta toxin family protein n=1 Tax=Fusobacterium simiae TaxID=855 RepID=UPI0020C2877A|nr:zeta toxin family protein [Fusobacterium simiae]MDC7956389.1 zeta toxin family protein [Fusobacterium simiae]
MDKNFYIFAGVNGSGKSTLYKTNFLNKDIKNSVRINTDEIVYSFGSWKNSTDQIKAAKIAIQLRNKCFLEKKSFNEETTLTGKTILKTIDKAKELGYKIYLYYIGVDSPEIAKERVRNRVLRGGHNIPSDIIEKRYYESLKNLEKIVSKCDVIEIYDNSKVFSRVFYYENNQIVEKSIKKIKWLKDNLKKELENLEIKF